MVTWYCCTKGSKTWNNCFVIFVTLYINDSTEKVLATFFLTIKCICLPFKLKKKSIKYFRYFYFFLGDVSCNKYYLAYSKLVLVLLCNVYTHTAHADIYLYVCLCVFIQPLAFLYILSRVNNICTVYITIV